MDAAVGGEVQFGAAAGAGQPDMGEAAFFLKAGQQLLNSALFAGLATEPLDKTLQVLLAALLYRATPREFISMLRLPQASTH